MDNNIKNITLADKGKMRVEWAINSMPVLKQVGQYFEKELPLKGLRISVCLHVTTETAFLVIVLKAAGAEVMVCASNPLSTQDDVAAFLVRDYNIPVFAIKGESEQIYYQNLHAVLNFGPHLTVDDGADLVSVIHSKRRELLQGIIGGTEETTTGVIRLRAMAKDGFLS